MITIQRLLIIFCCSVCCLIASSCVTKALNFTDRFPSFVCEKKYMKSEMIIVIESPDNCIQKDSEPILVDPHEAISFLCSCHLEKVVSKVKFTGIYCIRLYYGNDEYDVLALSNDKIFIKFKGITYRLKEEDAKKMDIIITNMIGDRRLIPALSTKQTD